MSKEPIFEVISENENGLEIPENARFWLRWRSRLATSDAPMLWCIDHLARRKDPPKHQP
jgi:hypothetical protein